MSDTVGDGAPGAQDQQARRAVVVVNYASHDLLRENLAPLDLAAVSARVVIVDNFSSALERDAVRALCAEQGWVIVAQRNRGFGAGVNAGVAAARAAGSTTFVLLNPDARATAEDIRELAERVERDEKTVVSPDIRYPDGAHWFSGGTVLTTQGRVSTAPGTRVEHGNGWLSGACLAVGESLWSSVGGFDERYFLYWEDVDFSWRCTIAGARLLVLERVRISHSVGATQRAAGDAPAAGKSREYYYFNCRNRLLFAALNLDRATRRRWLATTLPYAIRLIRRGGLRTALRHPLRTVGASIAGSVAGIRTLARPPRSVAYTRRVIR